MGDFVLQMSRADVQRFSNARPIQDDKFRRKGQGPCNDDPLFLSSRQLLGIGAEMLCFQADQARVESPIDSPFDERIKDEVHGFVVQFTLMGFLTLQKGARKPTRRLEAPNKTQAKVLPAFGRRIDEGGVLQVMD